MAKALLVIDIQNDFLPPNGSLAVASGDEIVEPVIKLMNDPKQEWHRIVLTRDWHPPDHISFAKSHGKPEFSKIEYHSPIPGDSSVQEGVLWPVHCVQGTPGSQLAAPLIEEQKKLGCRVVDKGYLHDREYYSAFNDIWDYHRTELNNYLKSHHITDVYVVGLALDYCVKNTAISASKLGYKTYIIKDYTRAINTDSESERKLEAELKKYNVKLI
ncbi:hypothetical protein HG535_0B05490 [Zygotorulaspora mrakii]|uniref:nicotinamidase n=1 Tax=Zygotorulaspora mrakii TaxID=42260 RepID=A0A7H9AZA5_ZYGMR|nr:uncharacterized protein HG535_0B05490 [Zygotorulaspora mrakii]QLG71507.1 hypothetical protein HG535_0B05490 [Zygotorulaspora mrakii]